MSDDILQEAGKMMKRPNGYAPSMITQITGGLVAEIKRLRELHESAYQKADRHLNRVTKQRDDLQEQLAAKEAQINELQNLIKTQSAAFVEGNQRTAARLLDYMLC